MKLGEKTSELELIMEKLIAEKEILIREVNRLKVNLAQIKNLIQVPKLLNHRDHADNNGWRLIHYFCICPNHESILYLINKGVKLDVKTIYSSYPIKFACESGSFKVIQVIQLIMSKGIELNISHKTYIKHNIN